MAGYLPAIRAVQGDCEAGYLPAIRAVQGDCEAVYVHAEMSDDDPGNNSPLDQWKTGQERGTSAAIMMLRTPG